MMLPTHISLPVVDFIFAKSTFKSTVKINFDFAKINHYISIS